MVLPDVTQEERTQACVRYIKADEALREFVTRGDLLWPRDAAEFKRLEHERNEAYREHMWLSWGIQV